MSDMQLSAKKRTEKGSVSRTEQEIPAVVYGKNQEPISLTIVRGDFQRLFDRASASTIVELDVEGEKESLEVLVHEMQVDAAKNEMIHVDFYAVVKGQALVTEVSINFVGEAPGARENLLVTVRDIIEISAKPSDLPGEIDVDISGLNEVGDHITIGDIKLPKGVELTNTEEDFLIEPIIKIDYQREEEEEPEETEEISADDIPTTEQGPAETGDNNEDAKK